MKSLGWPKFKLGMVTKIFFCSLFLFFLFPLNCYAEGDSGMSASGSRGGWWRFGAHYGITSTEYALIGKNSSSVHSDHLDGTIAGGSIDFGGVAGIETGFYVAKRRFHMRVNQVQTTYEIKSYEIPLMFRLRFRYFQWGLGLMYRQMENMLSSKTHGVTIQQSHNEAGFKRDDLDFMTQFRIIVPLWYIYLTAEARGWLGMADLGQPGDSLNSTHAVGGEILTGVMF